MIRDGILLAGMLIVIGMSFKDWFRALCLMLPLLAVLERPDMPRSMFDIPGLNPFNLLIGFVLLGWLAQKGKENLTWDIPKPINRLLVIYGLIFFVSFLRLILDTESISAFHISRGATPPGVGELIINDFINSIKWVIPGLLIFHGAINKERIKFCIWMMLVTVLLIALQIISKMMPALLGDGDMAERALRVLDRDIGYHRVDLAAIMAGAAWAFLAFRINAENRLMSLMLIIGFITCTLALALTGGRAGYVAWAACGLLFAYLRWRRLLIIGPLMILIAIPLIPGLYDRLTLGFSEESYSGYAQSGRSEIDTIDESGRDLYQITSGRVLLWPIVIEHILESPLLGYGMRGLQKLRLNLEVRELGAGSLNVGHPHNAYLELMLDNGLIAAFFVLLFYFKLLWFGKNLFASKTHERIIIATAGVFLAFTFTQLIAAIGAQSFYPIQGQAMMWCSIGLLLRLISNQKPQSET